MFTTGSKFLIGAAVLAAVCAVAYGVTQDGVMGTIGLASAAVALTFLAAINVWLRDSNVPADEPVAVATSSAAQPAPMRSIWPLGLALSLSIIVVGLVSYQAVFIIGILMMVGTGGEWVLQAWSERASTDPAYNEEVRDRLAGPLEFPLAGAVAVGIIVYLFSRVMLWLSKTNTVIAFSVLAVVLLVFAFLFAYRRGIQRRYLAGLSAIAVIALIAGGAATALDGERDIHVHETVSTDPEVCLTPEETEADEKASQTVSNTADIAATITLTADEQLEFSDPGGLGEGSGTLSLPRSNPSNILFKNESAEERRLTVDLGEIEVETDDGATGLIANVACTTLVEEGGENLLTLTIPIPSVAFEDGYSFVVPGLDAPRIELVVL